MDVYRRVTKPPPSLPPAQSDASDDAGGNGTTAGIAPLITMLAVLAIILIFCFCGAPAVRNFCRRRVCFCCPEPDEENPSAHRDEDDFVVLSAMHNTKNGEVRQSITAPSALQQ